MDYADFLHRKTHLDTRDGFRPTFLPDAMFDFQKALAEWSVFQGRTALLVDTGLGKTLMQLVWAENVVRHTNKPVLILTPLAVTSQTVREAAKFSIEATRSSDGKPAPNITVTNYERLHHFDPDDYAGVVCDESSILKNFDGKTKTAVTAFVRKMRYRLLATATPAPNDFIELGTSSEALGYLGYTDMLNKFFKNDRNNTTSRRLYGKAVQWRFKGHAEIPFWRYVASWARAVRKPSDLGFDDGPYILPPLTEREHMVTSDAVPEGQLFKLPAVGMKAERQERRMTLDERCEHVAQLVDHDQPALVWAHLNDEADLLERLIPDAVQVSGSDKDDAKEEKLLGFASGDFRVLVTKPKIASKGLNWQHCGHQTFFPSHSFEDYYQCVRRSLRFGRVGPVTVDIVSTEAERGVLKNLQAKARRADQMFARLVELMHDYQTIDRNVVYTQQEVAPPWLTTSL